MRLLSTTALAGIIALAMAGCGSSEESNVAVQPPPSVPQPSQQPEPETEAKSSQESTLVAQKPIDTKPSAAPGLIQPTNPNQRTQQVQKGRSDPFAGLFTIAPPKVVVKPQVVPPSPKPPAAPPPPPQPIAIQPAPRPIAPPPPPSPPQPDIARGITVFGVVQVGDRYQAIVQVPTEATSRYVNEGQRLSDGQVLVKSIELNPGSEPVVVLEQNGIEVTRAVGEEPAKTADNNASTTSSSMTSTLPVTNSSVAEVNNIRLQDGSPNAIPAPPPPASKRSPAAAVPPPPPAVEPSSEAVQSHSRLEQPPSVTSVLPSTLASNPLSGVVDESQLDANYPPPAVRDAEMPQGHSKVESLKKRQNLQRYRQLVNRLKMGR